MFCLFFITIGGACASDLSNVTDMSNNPNFNQNTGDLSVTTYSTDSGDGVNNVSLDSSSRRSSDSSSNLANSYNFNNYGYINAGNSNLSSASVLSSIGNAASDSQSTVSNDSIVGYSAISDNSTVSDYSENISNGSVSDSNDKINTTISGSDSIVDKGDYYNVSLYDKDNSPLVNRNVSLNLSNAYGGSVIYNLVTDNNGIAGIQINLIPGQYTLTYSFLGDSEYNSAKTSVIINSAIRNSTSISSSVGFNITQGNDYVVTLVDDNGNPLVNQSVYFTVSYGSANKTYYAYTDENGIARLQINLMMGITWTMNYGFGGSSGYKSSSGNSTFIVVAPSNNTDENNTGNNTTGNNKTNIFGSGNQIIKGDYYNVTLLDSDGKPLAGKTINFTISIGSSSKTYYLVTDKNGVASIQINLAATQWNIDYSFDGDENYSASTNSSGLYVFNERLETIISGSGSSINKGGYYNITLTDKNGNPLSGKTVYFNLSIGDYSKVYTLITNENGVASIQINLAEGSNWNINYFYDGEVAYYPNSGNTSLTINEAQPSLTLEQIINAAADVKAYITGHYELPGSVGINGVQYSLGQFVYFMTQALLNIQAGSTDGVVIKDVANAIGSTGDSISDKLYLENYITLASNILGYINENGQLPNYASCDLGNVEANLYLFGFAKILAYYGANGQLPAYVTLTSSDVNGGPSLPTNQFLAGINEVNTVDDLSPYYVASGHDAISSAIQSLANSLTSGLTSDWDKAEAIYNYVRDSISYSYYANSKYSASGTLTYKKGNCCDQASLVVSLCRAAGIAARYSHGQGCKFTSMSTPQGHVWAQIYVNGVWYVADATSSRNSLGHVVNWDVYNFYSLRQYVHLGF